MQDLDADYLMEYAQALLMINFVRGRNFCSLMLDGGRRVYKKKATPLLA